MFITAMHLILQKKVQYILYLQVKSKLLKILYFVSEDIAAAKKPIRIEDQEVRDENGRRRFHGAFTGGFSAGYYNTGYKN